MFCLLRIASSRASVALRLPTLWLVGADRAHELATGSAVRAGEARMLCRHHNLSGMSVLCEVARRGAEVTSAYGDSILRERRAKEIATAAGRERGRFALAGKTGRTRIPAPGSAEIG